MKTKHFILIILCLSILFSFTGCRNSQQPSSTYRNTLAYNFSREVSDLCTNTKFNMKKGVKYAQEIYITIADGNCTVSALNPNNFGNDSKDLKSSGKTGTGNRLQDPTEGSDIETYLAISFANTFGMDINETFSVYAVCSNGGDRLFVACAEGRNSGLKAGIDFPEIEFANIGIVVPDFDYPDDVGTYKSEALR